MLSILAKWVLLDACMHIVFLMKEEDAQEPVVTCSVRFSASLWLNCGIMLISNAGRKIKINESQWDCEIGVNTHLSTELIKIYLFFYNIKYYKIQELYIREQKLCHKLFLLIILIYYKKLMPVSFCNKALCSDVS